MKRISFVICMLSVLFLSNSAYAVEYYYPITDLGSLYGFGSVARDINNNGQIVGWNYNSTNSEDMTPFLYENDTMTDIGSSYEAFAINDSGQIVGYSGLYENGVWTDIGISPRAINDNRQIVGGSGSQAYLWENGNLTDLGTLGGESWAYGININSNGQIVGYSFNNSGEMTAFLWENDTMIDLGTLGGNFSRAYGINDYSQIVGVSSTSSGENHAFLWDNGTMTDLGTLGGNESLAYRINNSGEIVGWAETSTGINNATLWTQTVVPEPISSILFITGGGVPSLL